MTERLYLSDAYLRTTTARVEAVEPDPEGGDRHRIRLDRTVMYATGGGQPHDTGHLAGLEVIAVTSSGGDVWHTVEGGPVPEVGTEVTVEIDWERRHRLMRTHTALHVLCGVIWNEWRVPVTGGNMEPLSARMDFEFDPLPEGFAAAVERLVNDALEADHPIEVSFLPRAEAVLDEDLIRTKVSLIPDTVAEIRVVDIVGLDRQADGGTHVHSTAEVGRVRVLKVENKGKGNKRVRLEIVDA